MLRLWRTHGHGKVRQCSAETELEIILIYQHSPIYQHCPFGVTCLSVPEGIYWMCRKSNKRRTNPAEVLCIENWMIQRVKYGIKVKVIFLLLTFHSIFSARSILDWEDNLTLFFAPSIWSTDGDKNFIKNAKSFLP